MAKEPVRNAALAAGGGFLGLAAFQAALALGAPLGGASWGGVHEGKLPRGLRIVSGVAVGFHEHGLRQGRRDVRWGSQPALD